MTKDFPKHIAIIMDGNGRWAESRGHARLFGHVRGAARAEEVIREAARLGVKALTLFAFSTENWSRPKSELTILWQIFRRYLIRSAKEFRDKNIKLTILGEIEKMSPFIREVLDPIIADTKDNSGMCLNIAFSYGSRREITYACQDIARSCVEGKLRPEEIDEDLVQSRLWSRHLGSIGDVDLLIRTSGEKRISNFMLWQSAYAELHFVEAYWPDFRALDLRSAIDEFLSRDRRFGNVPLSIEKVAGIASV